MSGHRESTGVFRFRTSMDDRKADERRIIDATLLGDFKTVQSLLARAGEAASCRLINCLDEKSRTILEIATENEHLEIVEHIMDNWARMLSYEKVNECMLLAISKGYVRIAVSLLKHPMYNTKDTKHHRLGTITNYYERSGGLGHTSRFSRDLTPLKLAAHCNQVDLISIFLERGDTVEHPHASYCQCNSCVNRRRFDPLKHSKATLNAYRALASPAYISLTSNDPLLTAFLLCDDMKKLGRNEPEFKSEYSELVQQCQNYAFGLLDACQSSWELSLILNQRATSLDEVGAKEEEPGDDSDQSENSLKRSTLDRLKLAIHYEQKQFVAHPYCQHHLSTIWYGSIPGWRRLRSFPHKLIILMLTYVCSPLLALVYLLAPSTWVGQVISTPLARFSLHFMSYLTFLVFLYLQSVFAESGSNQSLITDPCEVGNLSARWKNDPNESLACESVLSNIVSNSTDCGYEFRRTGLNGLDICIMVMLTGMIWAEVKEMWAQGIRRYLSSKWNWMDIAMGCLYVCSYVLQLIAQKRNQAAIWYFIEHETFCLDIAEGNDPLATEHLYYLYSNRMNWKPTDPIFVHEALFAVANVLSFFRLSYILPVSSFLGPLQISLGRMMGDILRFGVVFLIVFLAFFCSFLNLYWFLYKGSDFGTFFSTFLTLFWSQFGMSERSSPDVDDYYKHDGNSFVLTVTLGTFLFAVYHVILVLVMLNMLIAMMNHSFEEIENDQDVEWRFARARLWMTYFGKRATLPPPFNIIPSLKSFCRLLLCLRRWLQKLFRRGKDASQKREPHAKRRKNASDTTTTSIEFPDFNGPVSTHSHQITMETIVKRYLYRLQAGGDEDDIDDRDLDEIKNDISSLRFELLQLLGGRDDTGSGLGKSSKARENDKLDEDSVTGETSLGNSSEFGEIERMSDMEEKLDKLGNDIREMRNEILGAVQRKRKLTFEQGV